MKIPFLGGAYTGRSSNVSPEVCRNYFYERGKTGESLVSTPGGALFAALGAGPIRGAIPYNDNAFFVRGNTLFEVTSNGGFTSRGTLTTSAGFVSMAHNGTRTGAVQQLMIVDGTHGYIYNNVTQVLTAIADVDMVNADATVFVDGYFAFTESSSDKWWITELYDGTAIDPLDFYTAEGSPDRGVMILADRRDIFVFQERTTERFWNTGDANNTFQRYQGGFIEKGCAAPFTAKKFDNTVAWLGRDDEGQGQVVQIGDGNQVQILTTPEVAYQISTYTTITDAFAYVYQHEGHEFYVITFPTPGVTWAYDALTQEWHTRSHTISGEPGRERYNCHVFAHGKHLFGDYENGNIYVLDSTLGTLNGVAIPRERRTMSLGDENRVALRAVQLDMDEGSDSEMWLSWSKDGGRTFSSEISRSAGGVGNYAHRLMWRRLGHARNWTFRLRTWTTKPHVLKGLIGMVRGEPSLQEQLLADQ